MKHFDEVLRTVRNWCVNNNKRINSRGFDSDLTGMCCIASAKLFETLEQFGYAPALAVAEYENDSAHCFVICDDHVLDITATQFGMEKIEIIHEKMASEYWFWNPKMLFYSVDELIKYQKKTRWPKYQLVTHDIIRYNVSNIH